MRSAITVIAITAGAGYCAAPSAGGDSHEAGGDSDAAARCRRRRSLAPPTVRVLTDSVLLPPAATRRLSPPPSRPVHAPHATRRSNRGCLRRAGAGPRCSGCLQGRGGWGGSTSSARRWQPRLAGCGQRRDCGQGRGCGQRRGRHSKPLPSACRTPSTALGRAHGQRRSEPPPQGAGFRVPAPRRADARAVPPRQPIISSHWVGGRAAGPQGRCRRAALASLSGQAVGPCRGAGAASGALSLSFESCRCAAGPGRGCGAEPGAGPATQRAKLRRLSRPALKSPGPAAAPGRGIAVPVSLNSFKRFSSFQCLSGSKKLTRITGIQLHWNS